jgi:RNA polymerase sigma-70 factor, ECF subfamily
VNEANGSAERLARFRAIYQANYGPLLGYAMRRTRSAQDAADVVAETFLTAWRRLGDVPDGAESRLWLYGVARRVLANAHRSDARRNRLQASLQAGADREPQRNTLGGPDWFLDAVAEAFSHLRQSDRDLLGLVAWEGLSYQQLASVLGCSPGAVRIRVHRARRRLASQLARLGVDVKRQRQTGHVWTDGQPPVSTVEEAW